MPTYICVTCGTQFAPSAEPPPGCPICLDERQYVGPDGQRWTTSEELREAQIRGSSRSSRDSLASASSRGSRSASARCMSSDCCGIACRWYLDPGVEGIETIAISHPHYYTMMVDWAERFGARFSCTKPTENGSMRPSPRIEYWSGERRKISDALELVRLGGHFAGGTVCLWRDGADGRGVLLSGDILQVVSDRDWVSFMWSYPNLIPLPVAEIERIRAVVESLDFDRIYGAWWDRVIEGDAKAKVLRSADRYVDAITRGRG